MLVFTLWTPPSGIDGDSTNGRSPTEGRFVLNAVIGALVGVILGFIPLSPALGGAVAGYLQGGDRSEGVRVGAASGAVALVPALALGGLLAVTVLFGGGGARGFVALVVLLAAIVAVAALYLVGLGAVGGWLGVYVRESMQDDDDPVVTDRHVDGEGGVDGSEEATVDG